MPRTADLSYHVTKVTRPADFAGCLLLLIGMPILLYSAYLLYVKHDIHPFMKYGLIGSILVFASHFTPRLFAKSVEDTKEALDAFIAQGHARDEDAQRLVERVRRGESTEKYWLFLRPFALENELLVVSTRDSDLGGVPSLVQYPEESFHDAKRQPVDLFDNLQFGFSGLDGAPFIAVGHRPHELHGAVGFLETTDEQWRHDITALADRAAIIVCMPWDTPGVLWETRLLLQHSVSRMLFVMPPCYRARESIRSEGPLVLPWFDTYPMESSPEYSRRWADAVDPMVQAGLRVPDYKWHGMIFGYAGGQDLFVLRIPVHQREFWRCYDLIAKHLGFERAAKTN